MSITTKQPKKTSLDKHHKQPRAVGGKYTDENLVTLSPQEHMKHHGIWREREAEFEELKMLYDNYKSAQVCRMKASNQILAFQRGVDKLTPDTKKFLKEQIDRYEDYEIALGKDIAKWIKKYGKTNPYVASVMSVKFVGPVFAAGLLIYLDIEKAEHPSSFWKYVGIAGPSSERYTKNEASGGNKTLRNALYVWTGGLYKGQKIGSPYLDIILREKDRLEHCEKLMSHRHNGKNYEVRWCDNELPGMKGHRDMAARRKASKYFLADLWFVWRTLADLPTTDLYVKEHLGHESAIIEPKTRGWVF